MQKRLIIKANLLVLAIILLVYFFEIFRVIYFINEEGYDVAIGGINPISYWIKLDAKGYGWASMYSPMFTGIPIILLLAANIILLIKEYD